jgi:hypothetical protein
LRWGWVPPAVAAAAVAFALLVPLGTRAPRPEGSPRVARAVPAAAATPLVPPARNVAALLAAQEPDGRWAADPGLGGRAGDEAATALVLLALLQPGARALEHEPLARATATGSRWLAGRAAGLSPGAGPKEVRARAVVAAALLRVGSLTRDPALRPVAKDLLAAVTKDAAADADHVSRPWLEHALRAAEQAGWAGAEDERRALAAAPRPVEPSPSVAPRAPARSPAAAASAATPMRLALDTLRDEPALASSASFSLAR